MIWLRAELEQMLRLHHKQQPAAIEMAFASGEVSAFVLILHKAKSCLAKLVIQISCKWRYPCYYSFLHYGRYRIYLFLAISRTWAKKILIFFFADMLTMSWAQKRKNIHLLVVIRVSKMIVLSLYRIGRRTHFQYVGNLSFNWNFSLS